jgi:hypothetical protein
MKRERTRPIPPLSEREQRGFRASITVTEDGHELWTAGSWWSRWRTDSFPGAEFRTADGVWWRAVRIARVLAGLPDDPRFLRAACGAERCIRADHQEFVR